MSPDQLEQEQLKLLKEVLVEFERPGTLRAFVIGLLFPELNVIMSKLSTLAGITEERK